MPKILSFDALLQPEEFLYDAGREGNYRACGTAAQAVKEVMQSELTPRQREIVELHFFHGLNTVQIAGRLGLNKSTVSRTLKTGTKKVSNILRFYNFR